MPRYIARITVIIEATDTANAREFISDLMSRANDWEYVTIENIQTGPMILPEPTLEEAFDAAFDNEV